MALPIAKILLAVPWGKVIENAPMLVGQAQELWSSSKRKSPASLDASAASADPAVLARRITILEQANAALQVQLSETNALILRMAEQNATLVRRVEINRSLLYAAIGCATCALLGVIWILVR